MHDYIYVYLFGRIGNILFQIATAASLSDKLGCDYMAIPYPYSEISEDKTYADYINQFKDSLLRKVDIRYGGVISDCIYHETDFRFHPLPEDRNMLLYGYFQSEKYFNKNLVREIFQISPDLKSQLIQKYGDILKEKPISINVRRGDYLTKSSYHPVCDMEYFNQAMEFFGKERLYLVTSDDLAWCKDHFLGENFFFVDKTDPLENLYTQSLCDSNIMSNSSFSWWGAWLNPNVNKTVIAPKKWFGKEAGIDTTDLIPETWVQI